MTKQSRDEARKAMINGRPTEVYKDIEILIYHVDQHKVLMIWKGNAGKPYIHYSFKENSVYLQNYVDQEKKYADQRETYKKEEALKGKTKSTVATAAGMIKAMLKKDYPSIKFSVKSDYFANGNSIDVNWVDGIPESAIDSFLRQFEYGSFDGMTDCYNYDNKHDYPQTKYVMAHRNISNEKREIIKSQLAQLMNIENSDSSTIPIDYMINVRDYNCEAPLSALIYQISKDYDFTKKFNGVRYKKTESGENIMNVFELY